jgi:hypothetical protein
VESVSYGKRLLTDAHECKFVTNFKEEMGRYKGTSEKMKAGNVPARIMFTLGI